MERKDVGPVGPSADRSSESNAVPEQSLSATPLQAGMLFHAAAHPGSGVDVEHITMRLDEPLDLDRFTAAWQAVFERHRILSARFDSSRPTDPLLMLDRVEQVSFTVNDWSTLSEEESEQRIAETMTLDRLAGFDLAAGPVNRFTAARLAEDRWWILWSFHHSILDGRSFPIVLNEVMDLYDNGLETPLPERPGFDRYVEAITTQDLEAARRYWSSKLESFEAASSVPSAAPTEQADEAPSVASIELRIDRERSDRIRALASETGTSLNTCIQAAWYLTLAHYSSQPTVTFGTTRACRHVVADSAGMVGLLINTVPMLLPVDRNETVAELLERLRGEQIDLRAHEAAPLSLIADCVDAGAGDLFESIVVFDDASLTNRMSAAFPEHADTRRFHYDGQTNYPLTLLAYGDPEITVRLEYAVDNYSSEAAGLVLEHYRNLLTGMAADPDRAAVTIAYLTEAEHERYDGWNATDQAYDLDTTLHALFERQVAASPDAPALLAGSATLTYAEFNRSSNRLAHHLRANGVGPGVMVGVYAERSFEMMIAIYAIIKAGGAYVPLDPEHPGERLQFMAEDSGVGFILTQSHLADSLPDTGATPLVLDAADRPWADEPDTNPEPLGGPDDIAYLLYTSGSTGRPKGVMIEHRAIVNRLLWMQEAYGLTVDDCVLQKTPYTFDVSVWELFWPLQVGARLVMAEPGGHRDTAYLAETIEQHAVTTLHFVPSMLQLFVEEPSIGRCTSIKRIICSGEALPRSLQDRLFEVLPTELHNLYGPTEAAVDVTWWICDADSPLDTVPIGYPIANTQVHVLDADLQRVPVGVAGELHIGGVQLARGYHNREELTAEKFVPDPWSDRPDGRVYRTGDLVRHMPDGAVEFLGRLDHQIKIRGQRVELGEIEAAIADHPAIREVVVVASGSNAADTKLVAYVVGHQHSLTDDGSSEQALRDHCEISLPSYMVPTVWMVLPELPLNANGKVDRAALPAPQLTSRGEIVSARSPVETEVLAVWQTVLDGEQIGVTEAFFDVGGNSLLLVRLAQLLTDRFDRDVTVQQLLRFTTVRQQAELLQQTENAPDEAVAAGVAAAEARRSKRSSRRRSRTART